MGLMNTLIDDMSLENIAHNHFNGFFDEVVKSMQYLIDRNHIFLGKDYHEAKHRVKQEIKIIEQSGLLSLIKKRTNVTLDFNIVGREHDNAYVYPLELDRNHVLREVHKEWQSSALLESMLNDIKGKFIHSVDLKKVWVSGPLADEECPIYLTYHHFTGYYSAEEVAAIFLHELGHWMTYLIYFGKTMAMSTVIGQAINVFNSSDNDQHRVEVLRVVKDELELDELDVDEAVSWSSTGLISFIALSTSRKGFNATDSYAYDANSFEALSDQFATRLGAGPYLASALSKYQSRYTKYMLVGLIPLAIQLVVAAIKNGPKILLYILKDLVIAIVILMILLAFLAIISSRPTETYDKPLDRIVRIRNDIINAMKNSSLTKDQKKFLLDQIDAMDSVIKNSSNGLDLASILGKIFNPTWRGDLNTKKAIQEIEKLTNNNLYHSSTKLSTLG